MIGASPNVLELYCTCLLPASYLYLLAPLKLDIQMASTTRCTPLVQTRSDRGLSNGTATFAGLLLYDTLFY